MATGRKSVIGFVGVALLFAIVACGPALTTKAPPAAAGQTLSAASAPATAQSTDAVVWGRVPYCNCFAGSATANVAGALKAAKLTVSLQELSPRDGWLYFAVTFDPQAATWDQVGDAMQTGGAELIDGPP